MNIVDQLKQIGAIIGVIGPIMGIVLKVYILPAVQEDTKKSLQPLIDQQQEMISKQNEIINRLEYVSLVTAQTVPDSVRNKIAKEYYEMKGKKY